MYFIGQTLETIDIADTQTTTTVPKYGPKIKTLAYGIYTLTTLCNTLF